MITFHQYISRKKNLMNTKSIQWVLRVAVAGEFIGHGVFALQGKPEWVGWFAIFGISNVETATTLLLVLGLLDVALAILVLVNRFVLLCCGWRFGIFGPRLCGRSSVCPSGTLLSDGQTGGSVGTASADGVAEKAKEWIVNLATRMVSHRVDAIDRRLVRW